MRHEDLVEEIAKQLKPSIYVELGVFQLECFNRVVRHVKQKAFAIDIKDNSIYMDPGPERSFHRCSTEEFSSTWHNEIKLDIDMIFIDADHSKDAVLQDVKNFLPFLKEDSGIMLLHDTWPLNKQQTAPGYSGDCYKVTKTLKEKLGNHIELITLPVPYGLTLIRKVGDNWRNGNANNPKAQ